MDEDRKRRYQYNLLEEERVTRFLRERLDAFDGFLAAVDRWLTSMP